jgi:hypothetical protein
MNEWRDSHEPVEPQTARSSDGESHDVENAAVLLINGMPFVGEVKTHEQLCMIYPSGKSNSIDEQMMVRDWAHVHQIGISAVIGWNPRDHEIHARLTSVCSIGLQWKLFRVPQNERFSAETVSEFTITS